MHAHPPLTQTNTTQLTYKRARRAKTKTKITFRTIQHPVRERRGKRGGTHPPTHRENGEGKKERVRRELDVRVVSVMKY